MQHATATNVPPLPRRNATHTRLHHHNRGVHVGYEWGGNGGTPSGAPCVCPLPHLSGQRVVCRQGHSRGVVIADATCVVCMAYARTAAVVRMRCCHVRAIGARHGGGLGYGARGTCAGTRAGVVRRAQTHVLPPYGSTQLPACSQGVPAERCLLTGCNIAPAANNNTTSSSHLCSRAPTIIAAEWEWANHPRGGAQYLHFCVL